MFVWRQSIIAFIGIDVPKPDIYKTKHVPIKACSKCSKSKKPRFDFRNKVVFEDQQTLIISTEYKNKENANYHETELGSIHCNHIGIGSAVSNEESM